MAKRIKIITSSGGLNSGKNSSVTFDITDNADIGGDAFKATALNIATEWADMLNATSFVKGILATNMIHTADGWKQDGLSMKFGYAIQGTRAADNSAGGPHPAPPYITLRVLKNLGPGRPGSIISRTSLNMQDTVAQPASGQLELTQAARDYFQGQLDGFFGNVAGLVVFSDKFANPRVVRSLVIGGVVDNDPSRKRRSKKQKDFQAAWADIAEDLKQAKALHAQGEQGGVSVLNVPTALQLIANDMKAILAKYAPAIAAEVLKKLPEWLKELMS